MNEKKVVKKKKTNNKKKNINSKTTIKRSNSKKPKTISKKQPIKKKNINKEKQIEVIDNNINNKKSKVKEKITIISIITIILAIVLFFFSYFTPKIVDIIEVRKIKNEINSIVKEQDIDKVKEMLSNNISVGKRLEIEKRLENTAFNLLNIKKSIDEIDNNDSIKNSLTVLTIDDSNLLQLYEEKEKIVNNINIKINNIYNNNSNFDISHDKKLFNKLLKKIYDIVDIEDINRLIDYFNKTKIPLKYLKENREYYEASDNSFLFKKRRIKEEYDNLIKELDNSINYSKTLLIEDKNPPVINADNITIYQGNTVNIKEKVKCIDEIDDEVECGIEGSFDSSKIGEYKIKITSVDKSNNISEKTISVIVRAKPVSGNKPYYIEVIRNHNVVVIYGKDNNNQYTKIVKVFVASVGKNGKTPTGTWTTTRGQVWGGLFGGVYGQYTTRIHGNYLFHSVPYYSANKNNLEWEEYNKLGTAASLGCIRLAVRDAKWIYDNISNGTTVKIYDGNLPSGISKPSAIKIPTNSPNRGWDPTDPDPNNPWK